MDSVEKVFLIAVRPYVHKKVQCFSPGVRLGSNALLCQIYKVLTVFFILWKYKPDVVITLGLIPHGVYALLLGKAFKRKTIYLSMGMKELIYSTGNGLGALLREVAFMADLIGTRGTHSKEQLVRSGFKNEKIFVPHNVFDFEQFKPREEKKVFDLIYVGLLEPYKRVDVLVSTVHRLVTEKGMTDIRMAIVGSGHLKKKLRRTCHRLGLDDHIAFIPSGDAEHVSSMLNQSKLFVMTSLSEGLPMAVIEAMSCGLPVVAFDHADICDVAHHGQNSLLSLPDETDTFVKNVELLLKDSELYDLLRQNAVHIREEKRQHYSTRYIRNIWERALTNL